MSWVLCRYKVTYAEGSGLEAVGPDWEDPEHFLLYEADPAWVGDPEMGKGWRQWDILNLTTGKRTGCIVADLVGPHPSEPAPTDQPGGVVVGPIVDLAAAPRAHQPHEAHPVHPHLGSDPVPGPAGLMGSHQQGPTFG